MTPTKRLFLSPPHMGGNEQDFVRQAFESNYIAPLGPMVDAFEAEFAAYTGIPYCLALSSGTSATHLALRHVLGRAGTSSHGPWGRTPASNRPLVLASTLTFIGSVTPAAFVNCDIAFIDCDRDTWNMDSALLEQELVACEREGRRPAAVIPTDLYGQCCDLPAILDICRRFEVPVICDSAEAMGARYCGEKSEGRGKGTGGGSPKRGTWRHAGYDAWASVYSFNGNKIITTSGGGMLASHDKALIDHARKLSQQARDAAPWYEHSEIGYNYRMSNLLAAVGRGQLQVLDSRVQRKREIFARYQDRLGAVPGITLMPEADFCRGNRWLTALLIDPAGFGIDTHAVREALARENIEARPVWKPMHLQPVFEACRVRSATCGVETGQEAIKRLGHGLPGPSGSRLVSEDLFLRGLCLPSGTAMTDADIARVADIMRKATNAQSARRVTGRSSRVMP